MTFAAAFAEMAQSFGSDGPFWPARIISQAAITFDDGGSIVESEDDPTERTCTAQVDRVTEAMRAQEGFTEKDQRILVLSDTLAGVITTDDEIEIMDGPNAGIWSVEWVGRDPVNVGWVLRGRKS